MTLSTLELHNPFNMTDTAREHLMEQLEARFPEGFALFYNADGEFADPLVWFPDRCRGRFLGENIEYNFPWYWGGPVSEEDDAEEEWSEGGEEY